MDVLGLATQGNTNLGHWITGVAIGPIVQNRSITEHLEH
jgi:hypothetical protein